MKQSVIDERIKQLRSAAKAGEFIAPVNVLFLLEQLDKANKEIATLRQKYNHTMEWIDDAARQ